jgi:hypothetical protein
MKLRREISLAGCFLLAGGSGALAQCEPPPGWAKVFVPGGPPRYVDGQQGPSGGSGGVFCESNDVHPAFRLHSISVNSGATIDSINITYDIPLGDVNPKDVGVSDHQHCGGTGGHQVLNEPPRKDQPTLFLSPGEHIVRVSGRYGNTVDFLYIQTSAPQFRNYGNENSKASGTFDFIAPAGTEITALVTKACTFVDAVGVVLKPLSQ